ncbi:hypothetical protein ACJRO7_028813 [Eucalyptus globulus]|uniref:Uncharacterized protein n=1 Tax=Eucalyptus globulus TaxID=34317 RepID=A0ABD3JX36_EUCGL
MYNYSYRSVEFYRALTINGHDQSDLSEQINGEGKAEGFCLITSDVHRSRFDASTRINQSTEKKTEQQGDNDSLSVDMVVVRTRDAKASATRFIVLFWEHRS